MVTKQEFLKYVKVQKSGVTNMFDITKVVELSGLDREQVKDCMLNYSVYRYKYLMEVTTK